MILTQGYLLPTCARPLALPTLTFLPFCPQRRIAEGLLQGFVGSPGRANFLVSL